VRWGVPQPLRVTVRIALVCANRGIGLEVRQLSGRRFRTILTARDEERGRAAADELGNEFVRLDVSDDASIDRCSRFVDDQRYESAISNS
jgi:short-subunit dehydrogenase